MGSIVNSLAIQRKIRRLLGGGRPRVLDLFSGCGGLSMGFSKADFEITAAMEIDEIAAHTHAINFFPDDGERIELHERPRDITIVEPDELVTEFGLGDASLAFDVVIGGPPCQAYARVGRAKLREVHDHPEGYKIDPRGNLYLRYLHYVKELRPLALLMENVPDMLNYGGYNVAEEMVEYLRELGYVTKYSLINSVHFGVPQLRERVYVIALREELETSVKFPEATHYQVLPRGYLGARSVAVKQIELFEDSGYVISDPGHDELPPAITAGEAVEDLPPIMKHQEGLLKRGPRRFTELAPYSKNDDLSEFASSMRSWKGFEAGEGVYDHVLRYLPRDTEIFRNMKQGDEYPAALHVATELFEKEASRRGLVLNKDDWIALHRKMIPPYPVHSFPNRWWKLREDKPSRTLMAHIGKDTYSHIHYDSKQARVITPREAARLQSFPDGFEFAGTMNSAFRQIGNAVPPLMAHAIAKTIEKSLIEGCTKVATGFVAAAE